MKKINLLVISCISAIILFLILTLIQNRIINQEEVQTVYIANIDVLRDTEIKKDAYKAVLVPTSLVINTDAVVNLEELQGKYAREPINKGQIIFKQDIALKDELKIITTESGLEKIAVKIKSAENAIAYQLKPKDRIHLYFTGKSGVINDAFLKYGIKFDNTKSDNSLQTSKIIENIEILGVYDELGRSYENSAFDKLDTIVIAVEPEVAEMINNLRNQGTFDITG